MGWQLQNEGRREEKKKNSQNPPRQISACFPGVPLLCEDGSFRSAGGGPRVSPSLCPSRSSSRDVREGVPPAPTGHCATRGSPSHLSPPCHRPNPPVLPWPHPSPQSRVAGETGADTRHLGNQGTDKVRVNNVVAHIAV